jgi:ornithine decarboxylase
MPAKFILSKSILQEQINKLKNLNLKISYSYKTNRVVGKTIQQLDPEIQFSIHAQEEIQDIQDKSKIWFFTQAESEQELQQLINQNITNFVIDNEVDLQRILNTIQNQDKKINLSLRMKFMEHRIGTGKYFVYGMPSTTINKLIQQIKNNPEINKKINQLGIHLHRKSQNTSEWEIKQEIEDSLTPESLKNIDFINLGGGLPSIYRSSSIDVSKYIFNKINETVDYLKQNNIQTFIEPGRFLAAPCIKLETEIIQIQENKNIIVNTTIYNCALDNILTGTKMLVQGEKENQIQQSIQTQEPETQTYLIKGNSPTRDDIFRYKVTLPKKQIGDKITFLNAGAYNYTTDFFGYRQIPTEIQ